jgi:hypothetical protein
LDGKGGAGVALGGREKGKREKGKGKREKGEGRREKGKEGDGYS